eukprot:1162042-Pelagomonas_calceolata.AAC.3
MQDTIMHIMHPGQWQCKVYNHMVKSGRQFMDLQASFGCLAGQGLPASVRPLTSACTCMGAYPRRPWGHPPC